MDYWVWLGFGGFVVAMLLVDLVLFGRRGQEIPFRRALAWSVGWTALGLAFTAAVYGLDGSVAAEAYLAGFLIEKSLSLDNLFVFALIFAYCAVPLALQRRVLFWGIVGALVLRGVFILAGASLLDAFHWMIYVFGGFLIVTGVRMARHIEIEPNRNPVLRLFRRLVPSTPQFHDDRFLVRHGGRRLATPLLVALVLVGVFDVIFALDSIPAIFAVTRDTFIVYAANAFSLLGLAALYIVLAGMLERFRHLNVGLAIILVFVGAKMVLSDVAHIPVWVSLVVIVATLAATVGISVVRAGRADVSPPGYRLLPARPRG
jgi:tellurite resistance protein TerC